MLRELSVQDVARLIGAAHAGAAPVLLDVREPWEFSLAVIRSAQAETLSIPMREIPARLAEIDAQRPVICVCHHGMRSLQVAHFLVQQGYEDVINLQGGIDAWSEQIDPGVPRY